MIDIKIIFEVHSDHSSHMKLFRNLLRHREIKPIQTYEEVRKD